MDLRVTHCWPYLIVSFGPIVRSTRVAKSAIVDKDGEGYRHATAVLDAATGASTDATLLLLLLLMLLLERRR